MVSEMQCQRERHRGEKSCLVTMWSVGMWGLFTRGENHITMQLCVRLYVHALPCVLFIWPANTGCINYLACVSAAELCRDTTSGKRPRTNGEHLSLPNASARQCYSSSRYPQKLISGIAELVLSDKKLYMHFCTFLTYNESRYRCVGCCIAGELNFQPRPGRFQARLIGDKI